MASGGSGPNLPGPIVVIDDEPYALRAMSYLLTHEGYEVVTASNGEEGLERVRELRPPLVFLDIMMPRLDGHEVCQQIRAMQPWPTAYTYLHRQGQPPLRLMIQKATARAASTQTTPGTAGTDSQSSFVVAGGHSSEVVILELQPAGKRRMSATEFLRGHPLQPGDRFGPEA